MHSLRIGSVLGFEVRLHASWFILFFLILWSFAAVVFPAQTPGRTGQTYAAMGVVATLLFFASLLAHELSHSLVARTRGIPMEGITLFIFGGMARSRAESRGPGDEFLIAGAGPLASFALALLTGAVAWLGIRLGWSGAMVAVATQLAILNLVLAVFNLLPGLPLDGGRLLRAAVWRATGSLTRATRVASIGGKGIGLLLIALGVLQLLSANPLGGVWLVLIGIFLRSAAESSYLQVLLDRTLSGVPVTELMTRDPVGVPADLSLRELVDRILLEGRHLGYPVIRDGAPVGLVTLHEVRRVPREQWADRTVGSAMEPLSARLVVGPGEDVERVLAALSAAPQGRLLVVEDDRLLGILTRSDLARWLERARLLDPG